MGKPKSETTELPIARRLGKGWDKVNAGYGVPKESAAETARDAGFIGGNQPTTSTSANGYKVG